MNGRSNEDLLLTLEIGRIIAFFLDCLLEAISL